VQKYIVCISPKKYISCTENSVLLVEYFFNLKQKQQNQHKTWLNSSNNNPVMKNYLISKFVFKFLLNTVNDNDSQPKLLCYLFFLQGPTILGIY